MKEAGPWFNDGERSTAKGWARLTTRLSASLRQSAFERPPDGNQRDS